MNQLTTRRGFGVSRRQGLTLVVLIAVELAVFLGPIRSFEAKQTAAAAQRDTLSRDVSKLDARLRRINTTGADELAALSDQWRRSAELLPSTRVEAITLIDPILAAAKLHNVTLAFTAPDAAKANNAGNGLAYLPLSVVATGTTASLGAFAAELATVSPLVTVDGAQYNALDAAPTAKFNLRIWYSATTTGDPGSTTFIPGTGTGIGPGGSTPTTTPGDKSPGTVVE